MSLEFLLIDIFYVTEALPNLSIAQLNCTDKVINFSNGIDMKWELYQTI